jgi:Delta3-Delta2-enoyl-CoA isomerase
MNFIHLLAHENIATIVINRPKVNAINEAVVEELREYFQKVADDSNVKAVILTGEGSFFSFGLDVPEFLSYSKDSFIKLITKFTDLYAYIFTFPKPVVAALNGHTIAGGCMIAIACDYRLMVSGKARISLNELTFGSTVFAGSVEMLKFLTGGRNAELALYTGAMYSAEEAKDLGLIHEVVCKENLRYSAQKTAEDFAKKDSCAFGSVKMLLRKQAGEEMKRKERGSILEFADIWYSENTWKNLQNIKIRD